MKWVQYHEDRHKERLEVEAWEKSNAQENDDGFFEPQQTIATLVNSELNQDNFEENVSRLLSKKRRSVYKSRE